ncbi:MAG: hypothetical protein V1779_02400 [bacterium]
MRYLILLPVILMIGLSNSSLLFSQTEVDSEFPDDEEYDWVYLNLDLGYGSSGPGGALGFRYRFLGLGISATGFATDIPKTSPQQSGNQSNLQQKSYPGNTVCGDFFGYYDLEEISLFANIGFYSSIDSVLLWDPEKRLYYRHGVVNQGGICFGFGAQMPLLFLNEDNDYLEQIVGGIGYHSQIGVYLRIAYRW